MMAGRRVRITLAATVLGCVVGVACTGGPSAAPSTAPGPNRTPSTPPRQPFAFTSVRVTPDAVTGSGGAAKADEAGNDIRDALSRFYDAVFADPSAWSGTVQTGAWDAFEPTLRDRAERDAESLTIGELGGSLATLTFPDARLAIRVLLDQNGKPQAAIATVAVDGSGTRTDGSSLSLSNRASFLLEPRDGAWRIVGYPSAKTSSEGGS
jgi:hypothetical protein